VEPSQGLEDRVDKTVVGGVRKANNALFSRAEDARRGCGIVAVDKVGGGEDVNECDGGQ